MIFFRNFAFANEVIIDAFSLSGDNDNKPLDASRDFLVAHSGGVSIL